MTLTTSIDFELPPELEASAPPEIWRNGRDDVRLMVATDTTIEHRHFTDLPDILTTGDVLVVNTSATLPAAVDGATSRGEPVELHLSTQMPDSRWTVELRHPDPDGSKPWFDATATVVLLPDHGIVMLHGLIAGSRRLWVATLDLPVGVDRYLAEHGRPIRYGHVPHDYGIDAYQTVFADEPGSAEMPSAARPFTAELVTRLVRRGIDVVPFVLHCGVSSPEGHEPPYAEWYRLDPVSAARINAARQAGHRVVAVGTTAVRTLETVVDSQGRVHPGEGWTEVIVTPERGVRSVDGLITGWHEPRASHLAMLEAIAGPELLEASYRAALEERYLWHEFGDSHLILPGRRSST